MVKLPIISAKNLIKILKKKGYILTRTSGSHHQYVFEDKTVTIPVHKGKNIGRGLLRAILKQSGISHEDFLKELGINN